MCACLHAMCWGTTPHQQHECCHTLYIMIHTTSGKAKHMPLTRLTQTTAHAPAAGRLLCPAPRPARLCSCTGTASPARGVATWWGHTQSHLHQQQHQHARLQHVMPGVKVWCISNHHATPGVRLFWCIVATTDPSGVRHCSYAYRQYRYMPLKATNRRQPQSIGRSH
jgi:hypothetical protein